MLRRTSVLLVSAVYVGTAELAASRKTLAVESVSHLDSALKNESEAELRSQIVAFYLNMPDRPARREFAEAQYAALGINASRIEGNALPDKIIGIDSAWLRAVDACAQTKAEYCIIADDDAVFRPISRQQFMQETRPEDSANAVLVAEQSQFFTELSQTLASLPGDAVDHSWAGLHLCSSGIKGNLKYLKQNERALGNPWPTEKFSRHPVWPGAPDSLLLKKSSAASYAKRARDMLAELRAKKLQAKKKDDVPLDVLMGKFYAHEDNATAHSDPNALSIFAAADPQLCQHLTDLSHDTRFRSSVSSFLGRF